MSAWDPELGPKGKPRARPFCQDCKRLVVRVRCDSCGMKLCRECRRTPMGGGHRRLRGARAAGDFLLHRGPTVTVSTRGQE